MSTNTQPSEHAMAAALIQSAPLIAMSGMDKPEAHDMVKRDARIIDQHAIAPAVAELQQQLDVAHATGTRFATQLADANRRVAERDKRIAELVAMVREYVEACYDGGENLGSLRQDQLEAKAKALLAKHGGSHE